MENDKLRVIMDYKKLSRDLKEKIQIAYSTGFGASMVSFKNNKGQKVIALRFETDDKIYLLRMTDEMARGLMENDLENTDYVYECGVALANEEDDIDTSTY